MAVLLLNHPGTRAALWHEKLRGKKRIARGEFSAVYDNGDTILKVTADSTHYELFVGPFAIESSKHTPVIVENHGIIGDQEDLPLYLIEVEKLVKVPAGSDAKRLARKIINQSCEAFSRSVTITKGDQNRASYLTFDALSKEDCYSQELRDTFREIAMFIADFEHANFDLHMGNFMVRPSTGDLVIVDPLCNSQALLESRARMIKKHNPEAAWRFAGI